MSDIAEKVAKLTPEKRLEFVCKLLTNGMTISLIENELKDDDYMDRVMDIFGEWEKYEHIVYAIMTKEAVSRLIDPILIFTKLREYKRDVYNHIQLHLPRDSARARALRFPGTAVLAGVAATRQRSRHQDHRLRHGDTRGQHQRELALADDRGLRRRRVDRPPTGVHA